MMQTLFIWVVVNTFKSADGGASWSNANRWTSAWQSMVLVNTDEVHADKHYLGFSR